MEKLISCAFNMDTACVELRFTDGSICSIDCIAVENEVADNRFQRSELGYLICNDPLAFLLVPRRQFRLPFVTFVVRLDHGQQAAGDAFNGVIGNLHATVFLTAEC